MKKKRKKKKRLTKPKHCCSYSAHTVQKHWMYSDIYKRKKKKKNKQKTKKKVSTVAIVPLGTVATIQNFKKKTKWLTKMELQMNSEKRYMNSAKILQKKEHKSMTRKK